MFLTSEKYYIPADYLLIYHFVINNVPCIDFKRQIISECFLLADRNS